MAILSPRPLIDTNGLIFWLPFTNGVADASGGSNGALTVGAFATGQPPLGSGPSITFNGAAQPLSLTPGAAFNNMTTTTHSIWVYIPAGVTFNSYVGLFTRGTSGNVVNFYMRGSGFLALYINAGSQAFDNSGPLSLTALNAWNHVALTLSSTAFATYINGKPNVSGVYGGYNVTSGQTQAIGYDVGSGGRNFNGSMADVRVYNRAMSAAEVNALYQQGVAFPLGVGETELPALAPSFVAYSLSASDGTFALTGSTAAVAAARKLSAAVASFSLTGSAATPKVGLHLPESTGVFALTGETASVSTARKLAAASAAFSLTGSAASVKAARELAAASAVFAFNGSGVTLRKGLEFSGAAGSFVLSGATVSFSFGFGLPLSTGVFTLSGETAGSVVARGFHASTGNFALSGHSASARFGAMLEASAGTFALSGHTASPTRGAAFSLSPGVFLLSGHSGTGVVFRPDLTPPRNINLIADRDSPFLRAGRRSPKLRASGGS